MSAPNSASIVSPEGVELELDVAGPSTRIMAYAIDSLIYLGIMLVVGFVVVLALAVSGPYLDDLGRRLESLVGGGQDPEALILALLPVFVLVWLVLTFGEVLYFTFWELVTRGRSPGKAIVGLRVVGLGGLPLDPMSSVIRNLLRIVDSLPAQYAFGIVAIVISERGQRLGDRAAGTLVIRTTRPQLAQAISTDGVQPLPLSREQVTALGPIEVELIRGTLRRERDMKKTEAEVLVRSVEQLLRTRLRVESEPAADARAWLLSALAAAERASR